MSQILMEGSVDSGALRTPGMEGHADKSHKIRII